MKWIIYGGAFLTFALSYVHGALFMSIVLLNVFTFGMTALYLMKFKNSQKFGHDFMDDKSIRFPILILISYMSIGFIHSAYYLYRFNKYPLTNDITPQDLDARLLADKRDKKLRKLGI